MAILAMFIAWRRFGKRLQTSFQYWRCRRFVWQFRKNHPELIALEKSGISSFAIAQCMTKRDNKQVREEMKKGWCLLVHNVWDYVVPRNEFELRQVLSRIKERRLHAKQL